MLPRIALLVLMMLGALAPTAEAYPLLEPGARAASVCATYGNQAAAQRAADRVDGDDDAEGVHCESLPCPCVKPSASNHAAQAAPAVKPARPACTRPSGVQPISFSKTKYPNIKRHFEAAVRKGWPRVLVLNRPGADARRDRLLRGWATRAGRDRDEYPPAVGRGRGKGLVRGSDPRGWKAHVAYVPSSENRSHGSTLGIKLRRFCDGTRFKYVFY